MSAVHAHCHLCGTKTSVTWQSVPKNAVPSRGKLPTNEGVEAKLVCAGCRDRHAVKPKGTVEK